MVRQQDATFTNQRVVLDGNDYVNCRFTNCELVFRGTDTVSMNGVTADNCRWTFDGAAGLTLKFLSALYHGGFSEMIDLTIQNIRQGSPQQPGAPTVG